MELVLTILFWTSVLLVVYNYLGYPLLLWMLAGGKAARKTVYEAGEELPFVSILMAVYNEEAVIESKLKSILESTYTSSQFELIIGSDASTDQTHAIIQKFQSQHANIHLKIFESRTGKPGIINALEPESKGEVLILTDADVLFEANTMMALVKHFKDPRIALVDSNMVSVATGPKGITQQETTYLQSEVMTKHREGQLWGAMMGPFGGCYALRKTFFHPVPPNYLVDDFYIAMQVLRQGGLCINELEAKCYEKVSSKMAEQFRRKVRISSGNFQNLVTFAGLLWPPFRPIGFAFLSHKVLRWIGPLLLLGAYGSNWYLAGQTIFYQWLFMGQNILIGLALLEQVLHKIGINAVILRFVSHFYSMNAALLLGLFNYLKGIRSNVWQPTQRE